MPAEACNWIPIKFIYRTSSSGSLKIVVIRDHELRQEESWGGNKLAENSTGEGDFESNLKWQ